MILQFTNQRIFASSEVPYDYRPVSEDEEYPRIILRVMIGKVKTLAFVDTGGINLLCSPQIATPLGLLSEDSIGEQRLLFRGVLLRGYLHRVPLTLFARTGNNLTFEVTAFIPQIHPNQQWPDDIPCVLGMSGCLERLRFAIDPETDTFYFGALGDL